MCVLEVGWLVDQLVGQLVGRLIGWSVGWLVGWRGEAGWVGGWASACYCLQRHSAGHSRPGRATACRGAAPATFALAELLPATACTAAS